MIYPNKNIIIELHNKVIEFSGGGTIGEINVGLLESVCQNIQNDDYYPTFHKKLGHLVFSTCKFHSFTDGNKRLAIALGCFLLEMNGYDFLVKDFMIEMESIVYNIAENKILKDFFIEILYNFINLNYHNNEKLKLKIIKNLLN